MSFWVYILRCKDDSYYTGHTENLENRIAQHQAGACNGYTATRLPVELVWSQAFTTREEALSAEMQIKGWSRKKKEAMMRADWHQVNRLSRGKHRHERVVQPSSPFALSVGSSIAEVEGRKLNILAPLAAPSALHASTLDAARLTLSTNGLVVFPIIQTSHFLGLDFGTSGARACVIDADKSVVWQQHFAYSMPDAQTPLNWRTALHSLLNALPKPLAAQINGIAIDGTSGTVLLCDAQLEPVSPALLYNDNRAQAQAVQLKAIAPKNHTVCTATSGLAKFLWLTQQNNQEQAVYFLHQADWLTALLSGQAGVSDYHNALKTGYDVENLCWPDWLMALPHSHLLPHVVAPGEIIGNIQADIAAHFGIHPQCKIHAGTTDSIAAFIATGVGELGVGVTSLGTTLVLKQLCKHRIEAPEYGIYSHRYGDKWLVGGASNTGAGVLRNFFSDAQLATLSEQIDPQQDSPLDYYPLPKIGERFPINDALLLPRLTPRPGDDVEFLHGLLQGLARIEAAGYAKLAELGAPTIQRVVTNGGGAKNLVWQQMRSRLIGVPVEAIAYSEAAYGAALLAHTHHS